jgi:hypothetical protein
MRKAIQGFAIAAAFAFCSYASSAKASLIYVSVFNGELQTIDTTTRVTTLIGNTDVVLSDIAFSPSGTLFGVDFINNTNLYTISLAPGLTTTTLVGSLGGVFVNALGFDSAGVLYGAGRNTLFTINTSTGPQCQQRSPLGLNRPPGGPTDDHAIAL